MERYLIISPKTVLNRFAPLAASLEIHPGDFLHLNSLYPPSVRQLFSGETTAELHAMISPSTFPALLIKESRE
ncbi:hypothetical protein [Nitrosospira lacus]|uniref:hypothetical protein n=1 Tax=Nitrosospira lacus TaxID=1288494 RepID=UPI00125EA9D0|nr:hypothetical protein [Nitrosospira lacus]